MYFYSSAQRKALKHADPIWKSLRIERGVNILLGLAYVGIIAYYVSLSRSVQGSSFGGVLFCIFLLQLIINQIRQERHWLRIGERRLYALHNDVSSVQGRTVKDLATQPATLPFVVSLDWKHNVLRTIGVVLAIFIILLVAAFFWPGTSNQNLWLSLLFTFIIIFIVIVVLLSFAYKAYFLWQRIEISEEGIKTRFRGQEYSMRWQDARLFAQYASGVMATQKQIFELSNEQIIVRWSHNDILGNFLLKTVSNATGNQDYNWLIARVNALVSEHTHLPLLRLDNASPIKLNNEVRERLQTLSYPDTEMEPAGTQLAQDDPLVQRLQWRGESGRVVLIGLGISLLMVIYGVLSLTYLLVIPPLQSFGNAFWLVIGGLLFVVLVLAAIILFVSQRYWQRLSIQRQRAAQQPTAFLANPQPTPKSEPLQPVSLIIRARSGRLFLMFFVEGFIIWSLFNGSLFNAIVHQRLETSGLLFSFIAALLMSVFMTPFIQRTTQQRIEVNAQGISTRLNMIDSHINWQDARLFARYRIMQPLSRSPRSQYYEIASQQTVVRWLANRSRLMAITTEPKMNQEQYERWLQELASYIKERTNLPLVDLDSVPMPAREK